MNELPADGRQRETGVVWALVPVKRLDDAKRRLSGHLQPEERRRLCAAMLADVLVTLSRCTDIAGVTVVSDDQGAARLARQFTCEHLPEGELGARGLNDVVGAATSRLAERGITDVMVVHGDLPTMTPADVSSLLDRHATLDKPAVTIAADRHRSGSNCVVASPSSAFGFRFGHASLQRHIDAARERGIACLIADIPGLALDVDTPDDLAVLQKDNGLRRDSQTAHCLRTFGYGESPIASARGAARQLVASE